MRHLKAFILIGLVIFTVANMFVTLPTPSTSGEVPWKDQDRSWYYDNLDDTDRQKIRQAFDYCVPREDIIEGLHLGFAEAIASPIGVNFDGVYEATIAAREYNTTTAGGLLEDVFGYSYDTSLAATNETSKVTAEPYFKMTIVAPTTNRARSQWVALISYNLNRVGIDCITKWWNWDIIMPRIFLDPVGTGFDYEHGGYDVVFTGHDASPDPTYKEYYDRDCFPPSSNFYWIEDGPATSGKWTPIAYPSITALWSHFYQEPNQDYRDAMLKEYQQWCYDNVPTCIIRQEMQLWALDADLQGFDLFHGIQQQICNWTGIGSTADIAQPGYYADFNPILSSSYYDSLISSNTHVALARRRGNYNLVQAYPWLAKDWTISADYKNYTVNLREGNHWSDGTLITADDVVFTYHAILNQTTTAPARGTLMNILGNDIGTDGKYSSVTKGVGEYQVIFTLPKPYIYVETVLFDIPIVQKKQLELIGLTNWKTHGTNWGSIPIAASGPYVLHDYDGTDTVELWVNPYYNATAMGHNPTAIGGGNWIPDPRTAGHITNVTFEVVKSGPTAVAGITSGTYDVLDSQIGIHADAQAVNNSVNCQLLYSYEWGYQEMAFNHNNPIFGMNPHDMWRHNPSPNYGYPGLFSLLFIPLIIIVVFFVVFFYAAVVSLFIGVVVVPPYVFVELIKKIGQNKGST